VNRIIHQYQKYFTKEAFRLSVFRASALFKASIVVNFLAETYATERASNPVTDIILSNTPVFDVDSIFVYGVVVLILTIAVVILSRPQRIPFVLESLAVFFLVRSLFMSLTHLGPFPEQAPLDLFPIARKFVFFGGDLFFSGHTGVPFLMALIFWKTPALRYFFLFWSVLFAITVLLGHYHYTIDVLAAYFITYTIYQIVIWLFPEDCKMLLS
jgi:hypothetical protein